VVFPIPANKKVGKTCVSDFGTLVNQPIEPLCEAQNSFFPFYVKRKSMGKSSENPDPSMVPLLNATACIGCRSRRHGRRRERRSDVRE
jgi:hypothetical protein